MGNFLEFFLPESVIHATTQLDAQRTKELLQRFQSNSLTKTETEELQRIIGTKDDGIFGKNSIRALQRYIGTTDDGDFKKLSHAALTNKIAELSDIADPEKKLNTITIGSETIPTPTKKEFNNFISNIYD